MPRNGLKPDGVRGLAKNALDHAEKLLHNDDRYKTASFVGLSGEYPLTLKSREDAEAYIKERIRLYVQTWVLPPLRKLNEKLNK